MKSAKFDDAIRHIVGKANTWPMKINKFVFSGIPGIGSGELPFLSPLTVISGPNSIGKTTLLRALWFCLDPATASTKQLTRRKLPSGLVKCELQKFGTSYDFEYDINYDVSYEENPGVDVNIWTAQKRSETCSQRCSPSIK